MKMIRNKINIGLIIGVLLSANPAYSSSEFSLRPSHGFAPDRKDETTGRFEDLAFTEKIAMANEVLRNDDYHGYRSFSFVERISVEWGACRVHGDLVINRDTNKGIIFTGNGGSGKTLMVLKLVRPNLSKIGFRNSRWLFGGTDGVWFFMAGGRLVGGCRGKSSGIRIKRLFSWDADSDGTSYVAPFGDKHVLFSRGESRQEFVEIDLIVYLNVKGRFNKQRIIENVSLEDLRRWFYTDKLLYEHEFIGSMRREEISDESLLEGFLKKVIVVELPKNPILRNYTAIVRWINRRVNLSLHQSLEEALFSSEGARKSRKTGI